MADLISRAALGIGKCDPNVFNDKAYGDGWNACIDIIEAAPTVDAVPVWWLDDKANDITRAPLYRRYAQMLIDEWQKKQEVRA